MNNYKLLISVVFFYVSSGFVLWKPLDCQYYLQHGFFYSGIYTIYPEGSSPEGFQVHCDMDTDGGGWTVFQRRVSDSDFYKTWTDYQLGFGNLSENFWLGNQLISMISTQGWYELRVDLESSDNETRFAGYQIFKLGDQSTDYTLTVEAYYGTAGDSLSEHSGRKFTTKDRHNDLYKDNCAVEFSGAWWYANCHKSNLNGLYGTSIYGKGLNWNSFKGYSVSMTKTEMKIRRWRPHE